MTTSKLICLPAKKVDPLFAGKSRFAQTMT
jgi:hypothetical protein